MGFKKMDVEEGENLEIEEISSKENQKIKLFILILILKAMFQSTVMVSDDTILIQLKLCYKIFFFILARLKWHSNNQQSQFTNFKQPTARIAPWQGQNVNNNMIPQKQVDFQGHVFQNPAMNEYQTVQPFTQQVPQMVSILY